MIRAHYFKSKNNFGDQLVEPIIKWICGENTVWVKSIIEGKLLCIGSELATGVMKKNDVVWGYGAKWDKEIVVPEGVKILAVRGYLTAGLLKGISVPCVGDPALLIPKIIPAPKKTSTYAIGIIPHFTDHEYFKGTVNPRIKLFDILGDKNKIIQDMHKCDIILSTSLHGCIVAEAYGIPAVWLKTPLSIIGGVDFKWNDYFTATGRDIQKAYILPKNFEVTDLARAKLKPLPKPIIQTESLINVWKAFYKSTEIKKIREG